MTRTVPEMLDCIEALARENEALKAGAVRVLPDRATFDAMCAMRDAINEYVPMPSLESDLLQGPENSVFCATVAEAVISEILRLRSSQPAAPVAVVKPLEWRDDGTNGHETDHAFGFYEVYPSPDGDMLSRDGVDSGIFPTLEAAKAAAQADYEARILAAIEVTPAPDPLADPRVKALVEAVRDIAEPRRLFSGGSPGVLRDRARAALAAMEARDD